ncbi:pseudaminic acid synthase [Candidatus Marinamargulisbacteria bacterium SCGC AG-343-D04]|nr:pseudaminic acid synthase [Candidatus Marinamargulisbacteria bacterium SCGC AG-343-D04]
MTKLNNLEKPYIIAEMSGNHNQSLDRAMKIIEAAAETGVDAIKIQTYTADTMTIQSNEGIFKINDPNSLWHGETLYDLYQKAHTPWEWHEPIFKKCKDLQIDCFSTPFDDTSVDFLESLNVPAYKIASFENTHLPLIKKVAQTGKPLIISTGMATESEIHDMVTTAKENGNKNLYLLKCTSTYPASPKDCNLKTIPQLQSQFNVDVGLSDHTLGIGVAIASIALGAKVIEKHFTLSRDEGGVDSAFSMEPAEMKILVEEVEKAYLALGKVSFGGSKNEEKSKLFRRSIYVVKDIKKGEFLTKDNIKIIRPGDGLAPKYFEDMLNKKAKKDIKKATPLNLEMIS